MVALDAGDRSLSDDLQETPVVRDINFFRAIVDQTIVIVLGRDIEISCIQGGPNIDKITNEDDKQRVTLTPGLSEVARLRLGWPESAMLAMQILDQGIKSGRFKKEAIIETIHGINEFEDALSEDVRNVI